LRRLILVTTTIVFTNCFCLLNLSLAQIWDKNLPSDSRFKILSEFADSAVRDNNTGLVWDREPSPEKVTWKEAKTNCLNMAAGGVWGWRLPSINEIMTLVDRRGKPGRPVMLPEGHPFNLPTNGDNYTYWSATADYNPASKSVFWLVHLSIGKAILATAAQEDAPPPHVKYFYWCVRGPMQEGRY